MLLLLLSVVVWKISKFFGGYCSIKVFLDSSNHMLGLFVVEPEMSLDWLITAQLGNFVGMFVFNFFLAGSALMGP